LPCGSLHYASRLNSGVRPQGKVLYIFRTHPENIPQVVRLRKHALNRRPNLEIGEHVLIARTLADDDGIPPIRYIMRYFRTLPDLHNETTAIWGRPWPFIMEFDDCRELSRPFDIRDVQVTTRNYGPGGPIVRVHPADEYAIEKLGLFT